MARGEQSFLDPELWNVSVCSSVNIIIIQPRQSLSHPPLVFRRKLLMAKCLHQLYRSVLVFGVFQSIFPKFVNNSEPSGNILRYLANRLGVAWQKMTDTQRTGRKAQLGSASALATVPRRHPFLPLSQKLRTHKQQAVVNLLLLRGTGFPL